MLNVLELVDLRLSFPWVPEPEGTGISSNLVLELLHGLGAQWSPVGEGVPEMTRLEKIPWEGEFTLRSDS